MSIRQISVFLENRPGKLYELTGLLARHGIDMRALSIAEATDFGIARIIVGDVDRCALALREGQFIAQLSDVLAFAVPDRPGGLHDLLKEFNAAQVNIEYMYSLIARDAKDAYMVFRVTDSSAFLAMLEEKGLKNVEPDELGIR